MTKESRLKLSTRESCRYRATSPIRRYCLREDPLGLTNQRAVIQICRIVEPWMDKVRIAVAGAGSIGVRHIEEIQRSQGAILSAIIDPSPKAIEVGQREDAPVYRSLSESIASHRPDGVVLATPNQMHVEQGLQCIAAGVPVLIEKPIAHTLEDGARLVQAAERANAKLLVGHHRRHSRILHKAIEIVQSGVSVNSSP